MQNLNELSKTLNGKSGQIDRIVTNVENFSDSLSKSKIPTMIAQVTTTLESLNTTLEKSQPRRRHGRSVPERPGVV